MKSGLSCFIFVCALLSIPSNTPPVVNPAICANPFHTMKKFYLLVVIVAFIYSIKVYCQFAWGEPGNIAQSEYSTEKKEEADKGMEAHYAVARDTVNKTMSEPASAATIVKPPVASKAGLPVKEVSSVKAVPAVNEAPSAKAVTPVKANLSVKDVHPVKTIAPVKTVPAVKTAVFIKTAPASKVAKTNMPAKTMEKGALAKSDKEHHKSVKPVKDIHAAKAAQVVDTIPLVETDQLVNTIKPLQDTSKGVSLYVSISGNSTPGPDSRVVTVTGQSAASKQADSLLVTVAVAEKADSAATAEDTTLNREEGLVVTDTLAGGNIVGMVVRTDTLPVCNGKPYVQRHYEITPRHKVDTAKTRVTLFFTQEEFDNYNAQMVAAPRLPATPSDEAGKANLRIYQHHSFCASTALVDKLSHGDEVQINPADSSIVWNAATLQWEITLEITGSGTLFAASWIP